MISSRVREPGRADRLLASGCVVVLLVDLAAVAAWGTRAPGVAVAREVLFAMAWLAVGLVALGVGRVALARLALCLALLLSVTLTAGLGLLDRGWAATLLVTIGHVLVPLQTPVVAHVVMAFPDGDVGGPRARWLVRAAYGLGACEIVLFGVTPGINQGECPECASPVQPLVNDSMLVQLASLIGILWLVLAAAAAAVIVAKYRRANSRQRRLLTLPYLSILVSITAFSAMAIAAAAEGRGLYASFEAVIVLQVVAMVGVPLFFSVGLLRERLSYARVSDLVRDLETAEPDVERALARALGDPELHVAFPVDGRYVDPDGRPVQLPEPGSRGVTPVGDPEQPFAVLIHDPQLADEPELLEAARAAAAMRLENVRLHAQVRAQLEDVRASRARLVAASDEARRRIERDLHDGAQQRLLAVGLALQLLEGKGLDDGRGELLAEARDELGHALRELRELAAGIHPATLTDYGLVAALMALAAHTAVPLRISADDVGRLRPEVEAAAYFAVNEAIANAVKHSGGKEVDVCIRTAPQTPLRLEVTVSDHGVGGADPNGAGLRGLVDRLATVEGTVTVSSPRGSGTTVRMEIPCASS
jgi:signal transduction histidine kinase